MVALLAIPILVAALSRQLLAFLASSLLAVIAFLIFEFPGSLPNVLIIGFGAASLLVSTAGLHQRRQLNGLRRELTRLSAAQTRLETAESRRVLADIRSTHSGRAPAIVDHAQGSVDGVQGGQNITGSSGEARERSLSAWPHGHAGGASIVEAGKMTTPLPKKAG